MNRFKLFKNCKHGFNIQLKNNSYWWIHDLHSGDDIPDDYIGWVDDGGCDVGKFIGYLNFKEDVMSKFLNYKGWQGTCEWSEDDQVYHGKVTGTTDLVTYECDSLWYIERVFKDAVDEWLKDKENHFE